MSWVALEGFQEVVPRFIGASAQDGKNSQAHRGILRQGVHGAKPEQRLFRFFKAPRLD